MSASIGGGFESRQVPGNMTSFSSLTYIPLILSLL